MTQEGLKKLKKLECDVHELQNTAAWLTTRILNFYRYEEDVLDRDAHMRLSYAGAALRDAEPCITDAVLELQKAYEGLLNKEQL